MCTIYYKNYIVTHVTRLERFLDLYLRASELLGCVSFRLCLVLTCNCSSAAFASMDNLAEVQLISLPDKCNKQDLYAFYSRMCKAVHNMNNWTILYQLNVMPYQVPRDGSWKQSCHITDVSRANINIIRRDLKMKQAVCACFIVFVSLLTLLQKFARMKIFETIENIGFPTDEAFNEIAMQMLNAEEQEMYNSKTKCLESIIAWRKHRQVRYKVSQFKHITRTIMMQIIVYHFDIVFHACGSIYLDNTAIFHNNNQFYNEKCLLRIRYEGVCAPDNYIQQLISWATEDIVKVCCCYLLFLCFICVD